MEFHKILIIELAYIGDLLMATPAFSEIRRNFPKSHITVICSSSRRTVLDRNPSIDEIIEIEKTSSGGLSIFATAAIIRKGGYDVVFLFHRAFGSAVVAFLGGVRRRIGFSTEHRSFLLTDRVHLDRSIHRTENDFNVLRKIGLDVDPATPLVFVPDPGDESKVRELLGSECIEKGFVVLNPNGSWETKMWPVVRFRELGLQLVERFGITLVGVGSEGERGTVEEMLDGGGMNLAGKTNLSELGIICRDSRLVVTNDSGPMHLAAASGAKVLGIFGPTSPDRCGPRSDSAIVLQRNELDCIACYKKTCPREFECMLQLQVENVFDEAVKLIGVNE